ncbi:mannan endo-1,4-beta-mannosidase 7-like [Corylus avellana]|uniref:mannan endo-1,4-beta-mannosidase 7-like n=1 Tax=Corylus avellana TaxID=13451 RepID=UPI00286D5F38|nr:mannan endo-1,4-beta-mannosidase 7-like [Corylus avellana]
MMKQYLGIALFVLILIKNHGNFLHVEADDGFVKTRGVHLILNGSPLYANGFNAYWLMYIASDTSQRDKITSAFEEATKRGLTIGRTWAFSDGGYRPLQSSPGSYNEQTFQGLDFAISEAGKHGIKLILSLVNNYEGYGGKKQYVEWARNQGQSLSSEDDFFTNSLVKGFYKNHIKTVLTRRNSLTGITYKDDPTIMAWELMNEPRCNADTSGKTLQDWITEMASYVKSIDKNHLLEVGLEGFYGESKKSSNPNGYLLGSDFITNNQIPGIDFATVHSYPDQWISGSTEETQLSFLNSWVKDHIEDAQNVLRMPVMFAEFGKSTKTSGVDERDRLYNIVYSKIYSSASGGGAAVGGLFWQLLAEGMDNFRDGYEVILGEDSSTASLIAQESQKLVRIRKMYTRLKNIEKWKKARDMRKGKHRN